MARLKRYFVPDQPQHVIQRGNNREPVFAAEDDYRFYQACLVDAASRHGVAVHAYVLMTNHVHLLAPRRPRRACPRPCSQSVDATYVQYFNHTYERTGTLWEGRYRATVIDTERYVFTCMRYIELNPVRAGMVAHPADYPWSSYPRNGLGVGDALVAEHDLYRRLGRTAADCCSAYRQLFGVDIGRADLEAIRQATNKGWALGNARFSEKIEALSRRRATPMSRGRHRQTSQPE